MEYREIILSHNGRGVSVNAPDKDGDIEVEYDHVNGDISFYMNHDEAINFARIILEMVTFDKN